MPDLPRIPADNEDGVDIPSEQRPPCRFRVGDELVGGNLGFIFVLRVPPYWDYEFGGWLIVPGGAGVHESNFILASELENWDRHPDGLRSWWTRKEGST